MIAARISRRGQSDIRQIWKSRSISNLSIESARGNCLSLLKEKDHSSYLLQSYVTKGPARDAYIGIRAFNLDTARIADSVSKPEIAMVRFDFWRSTIQKIFAKNNASVPPEPVAMLLAHSISSSTPHAVSLSKRFFLTLLQTREAYLNNPPFRNLDAMGSYGEGTYSQLNYLTQEAFYSTSEKVADFLADNPAVSQQASEVVAHIGQATGIASLLRGFSFFAKRRFIPLPVDLMAKHNVSQQSVIDAFHADKVRLPPGVSDVVFETATRANDHLISADSLMNQIKDSFSGSIPDSIFVPAMVAIPVQLYLERLQRYDFDPTHPGFNKNEWRLPYRSYKAYTLRRLT